MTRVYTWIVNRMASDKRGRGDERGQGTVEYVLVMLAVAAIAVVLISWAKSGSGKSALTGFFDDVIGWVAGAAAKFRA